MGGQEIQSVDKVRRGPGHGYGSVYDELLARILERCLHELCRPVPGADFVGFGESLYAHVCVLLPLVLVVIGGMC